MFNDVNSHNSENSRALINTQVIFDLYDEESAELAHEVLKTFRYEASKYYQQLFARLAEVDKPQVDRILHSLATMLRMIGAEDLAELAVKLERSALATVEFKHYLSLFQRLWAQLFTELEQYLGQQ